MICLFVCLFVTEESHDGLWSRELGKAPMLLVSLTPRQALSSHPCQQMVWLYWLQDRDSMPNWYTINHPATLHTQNETVTHCCSWMTLCTAGCILQTKLPSLVWHLATPDRTDWWFSEWLSYLTEILSVAYLGPGSIFFYPAKEPLLRLSSRNFTYILFYITSQVFFMIPIYFECNNINFFCVALLAFSTLIFPTQS